MLPPSSLKARTPYFGAGLGYREELREGIFSRAAEIDCLEILVDEYIVLPWKWSELENVCHQFAVIPHGVGLSVGSAAPPGAGYLQQIKRVSDLTQAPFYSEHLCMTRAPGVDLGHLSPLWFTEETLDRTIRNVAYVQDYLGKPLVLENVTYLLEIPDGTMSQTEFFTRVVDATGCGVLLDLTNVYINSVNHHHNPVTFLEQMPLPSVVQVHLAGGFWEEGLLVDGHSDPVHEESWQLLEVLASKIDVKAVIIEQDQNYPEIDALIQQIKRARAVIERGNRAHSTAS